MRMAQKSIQDIVGKEKITQDSKIKIVYNANVH